MRPFVHLALALLVASSVQAGDAPFETPTDLDAAQQLGLEALSGPNHRIERRVLNDGRSNRYRVRDGTHEIEAIGDRMARERAGEFEAIAALGKMKESDAYARGLEAAASSTLTLTRAVIADPVAALGKLPQGLDALLSDLGAAVQGIGRGAAASREDDALMKDLIGFNTLKRRLAHELGIDPYSSHARLQTELNDVAWAMFAGGAPIELALVTVPAGLTIALRAADRAQGGELDWKLPPATLRHAIERELAALGLSAQEAGSIAYHRHCTLRHQSLLVSMLVDMQGVDGRADLLRQALAAGDERACRQAQHAAELARAYHRNVKPVVAMAPRGGGLWLRDQAGTSVLAMPSDHLAWTAENAALVDTGTQVLWLAGTSSAPARAALAARRVIVHERVLGRFPTRLNVASVLLPERTPASAGASTENQTGKLVESVGTGLGDAVTGVLQGIGLNPASGAPKR